MQDTSVVCGHLFPRYEMSIRLKLMPSQGNDMLRIQESCGIFALRQKDSNPDLRVWRITLRPKHESDAATPSVFDN